MAIAEVCQKICVFGEIMLGQLTIRWVRREGAKPIAGDELMLRLRGRKEGRKEGRRARDTKGRAVGEMLSRSDHPTTTTT